MTQLLGILFNKQLLAHITYMKLAVAITYVYIVCFRSTISRNVPFSSHLHVPSMKTPVAFHLYLALNSNFHK